MHLADAGAHGKIFTSSDKYPEEELKLITELEKCAQKGIKIFGYIIDDECKQSFNECSKIYRSKGGSFETVDFFIIPKDEKPISMMGYKPEVMPIMPMSHMGMMPMNNMGMMPMNNMMGMSAPMAMNSQMNINMNFQMQALNSVQSILNK